MATNQQIMATKKARPVIMPETTQVGIKSVSSETVQKLHIIAGLENVSTQDVYRKALDTYVTLYEKQNGKLQIKPKGSGLNVI